MVAGRVATSENGNRKNLAVCDEKTVNSEEHKGDDQVLGSVYAARNGGRKQLTGYDSRHQSSIEQQHSFLTITQRSRRGRADNESETMALQERER